MPDASQCPECGALLPANLPRGLCSRCALLGALELSNGGSQVLQSVTLDVSSAAVSPAPRAPLALPKRFGDYATAQTRLMYWPESLASG